MCDDCGGPRISRRQALWVPPAVVGATLLGASPAEAATRRVALLLESAWDARPATGPFVRHRISHITIHHSAVILRDNRHAPTQLRTFQADHQARGWPDIAYHLLVDLLRSVLGFSFPSSWFQSVQPIFVVILAPIFAWIWIRLGRRDPSVPTKIAMGILFMGLAFLVLVPAGAMAQSGEGVRVSPMWLVLAYFGSELGELCVYPVGMSAVTKLSPARIMGLMMGVWFLSIAFGNKLAGYAAGFISSIPLQTLFGTVAIVLIVAALIMFALVKPIRALAAEGK